MTHMSTWVHRSFFCIKRVGINVFLQKKIFLVELEW